MDGDVRHSCGLFGVFGSWEAPELVFSGLQALQHRGQESAGIASADDQDIVCAKGEGLVINALDRQAVQGLRNPVAIGHVRYSTSGGPDPRNAQPLLVRYRYGPVALAHNGDIVNKRALRREGEQAGATFMTSSDTETVLALLARSAGSSFDESLDATLARLEGAYSFLVLRPGELHAVRDPHGFRPLSLGRKGDTWFLASETCAFALFGVEHLRDLEPGEHLRIDKKGLHSRRFAEPRRGARCVFEHVYFARPDSRLFGENVHQVRMRLGERLAHEHPVDADIVIAVPESGTSAALGYSRASGIPYDRGFVKNHYVGRTFIKPTSDLRESSARMKLNPMPEVVGGQRLIVVDDSIVRGTTSLGRIRALREAGAREVHFRISCPPTMWPCFYGIDFPTRRELIAAGKSIDEIAAFIGADTVGYLSLEGLLAAAHGTPTTFCHACFSGDYPTPLPPDVDPR